MHASLEGRAKCRRSANMSAVRQRRDFQHRVRIDDLHLESIDAHSRQAGNASGRDIVLPAARPARHHVALEPALRERRCAPYASVIRCKQAAVHVEQRHVGSGDGGARRAARHQLLNERDFVQVFSEGGELCPA